MLNPVVFTKITQDVPKVDLFASRLNCQIHPFVSWKPEPGTWAINAFSICCTNLIFYAFPPFSILGRVLAKVQQDRATGILVAPYLVRPTLVPTAPGNVDRTSTEAETRERPVANQRKSGYGAPASLKAGSIGDGYIRAALQGTGLSATATNLLCNAWREGTKRQYDSTLRRWGEFCTAWEVHPITPHINDVVEFLASLYTTGSQVLSQLLAVPCG